jgi:hypothetical protein
VTRVELDETARRFVEEAAAHGEVRIVANEPHARNLLEYIEKAYEERLRHGITPDDPVLFLEVTVADPSEFEARLQVTGEERHGYRWTEGNPVAHLLRFLIFGSGEVAPVTREVLREAEPDPQQRPFVHVA